jgi:radical SAM superfamily enzyme YgiQ (UPF0313 family)
LRILLISTYELGRQPFSLASAVAVLRADGHSVACLDAAVQAILPEAASHADLVAFSLPMHSATRLAIRLIRGIAASNPAAQICAFGVYASLNESHLRALGVHTILGGEFEAALRRIAARETPAPDPSPERVRFTLPDRSALPHPARYAALDFAGERRLTGYTESSRGCKHRCRHCPIVPVYQGTFRAVPAEVVLADIRQQVESGSRHITFGDPDFFNGPSHAARIVEALHREFPQVTYDATVKVEHLIRHQRLVELLGRTGCLFITSAVESVDDSVLAKLEKGHTYADFEEAVRRCRQAGIALSPTFLAFTPWTTIESYREMLAAIVSLGLIGNIAPVQLALRLLITARSRLLELDEIARLAGPFDREALVHPWSHPDPRVDRLCTTVSRMVRQEQARGAGRVAIFAEACRIAGVSSPLPDFNLVSRSAVPFLTEPWFC